MKPYIAVTARDVLMKPETKIILATRNRHKIREITAILSNLPLGIGSLLDYPGISEIPESGQTFAENALLKAEAAYQHAGILAIADDSGLEVDALKGEPGVYSARFAGNSHNHAKNNRKLLELLKDVPEPHRGAQFRCVAAVVGPQYERIVEGVVRGKIITELRGDKGFGYDPLFVPEGFDKTFAELGEEVKNRISHRALAFSQVREVLKELI